MNSSEAPTQRRLVAGLYASLTRLWSGLKNDSGWRRLRVPTAVATLSAILADFFKPVIWVVPFVTVFAIALLAVAAVAYWRLRRRDETTQLWLPARTAIVSAIAAVVFGAMWSAQASLPENDSVTGQLLRTALELQESLRSLEDTVESVGQDVSRVRELMEEGAAREVIARATETRDYADHGQVAAVEAIVARGGRLARMTLSGIDFTGVHLPDADLEETSFLFSRLDGSDLSSATLSLANLILSRLSDSDLSAADLSGARLTLAVAERARFVDIHGDDAEFSAARLREADFSGASLRRTSFAFADLTGVNFTDADLSEAVFLGAKLDNARFDGAVLDNTDLTGAVDPPMVLFEGDQGSVCRTDSIRGDRQSMQVFIIERIPSSAFSGGIEYSRLFEEWFGFDVAEPVLLPNCAERPFLTDWHFPLWKSQGGERLSDSFNLSFSQEFLQAGGRRAELIRRVRAQLIAKTD